MIVQRVSTMCRGTASFSSVSHPPCHYTGLNSFFWSANCIGCLCLWIWPMSQARGWCFMCLCRPSLFCYFWNRVFVNVWRNACVNEWMSRKMHCPKWCSWQPCELSRAPFLVSTSQKTKWGSKEWNVFSKIPLIIWLTWVHSLASYRQRLYQVELLHKGNFIYNK